MLIQAQKITTFIEQMFVAVGSSPAESRRIAENLVDASLRGHDSHGIIRVPRYISWQRDGKLLADQEVSVVSDSGSIVVLDGNFGFGQTVGPQAVQFGIKRAAETGVCVAGLRHAGHLGRIGAWAEQAAAAGQVSIHFVNVAGSVLVAPFGGVERRMSTNPVAIGMPSADGRPVILDFATSIVAEGKVLVAAKGGKPLPDDALIGPDGHPSGDPRLLYGDNDPAVTPDQKDGQGALRAVGEHKGSGLALMCELLAGALTGSGCTGPDYSRIYNGMLSIYMAADRFGSGDAISSELSRYISYFKSARPATPGQEVLVPGEPERNSRASRLEAGVPLPDDAWEAIVNTATGLGISAPQADG